MPPCFERLLHLPIAMLDKQIMTINATLTDMVGSAQRIDDVIR